MAHDRSLRSLIFGENPARTRTIPISSAMELRMLWKISSSNGLRDILITPNWSDVRF
jgi:hypothetical protein